MTTTTHYVLHGCMNAGQKHKISEFCNQVKEKQKAQDKMNTSEWNEMENKRNESQRMCSAK